MERLVWPLELTARRQPRTRPRLCKRFAAAIPRRSSSDPSRHLFSDFFRRKSRQQLTGSAARSLNIRSTKARAFLSADLSGPERTLIFCDWLFNPEVFKRSDLNPTMRLNFGT